MDALGLDASPPITSVMSNVGQTGEIDRASGEFGFREAFNQEQ